MKSPATRFVLFIVFLLLLGRTFAAAPKKEKPAPTVELSPFEVKAERIDFNKWIKVSSPHFLIYTDASQKETLLVAKHLEMTRLAVQNYFHANFKSEPPLIVLLPTKRSDWRKMESKDVEWQVASVTTGKSRAIVVLEDDWEESPGLLWSMVGIHFCSLMNIEGPTWFNTGLIEFFDTLIFSGDSLTVGKEGVSELSLLKFGWLPWGRFFAITRHSPEYTKENTDNYRYFGQATAFTHYLLTNADPKYMKELLQWSAFLEAQDHWTEDDFKRTFGVTTTELQQNISNLFNGGRYVTGKIVFKPEALRFPINVDTARPAEMRELFVLVQTMLRKTPESKTSLDSILTNGLKNEGFREILADSCWRNDRSKDALDQYRLLIKNGSTNAEVFHEAARIHLEAANAENDLNAHLGDEAEEALSWAKRAVELDPVNFEAWETLAWVRAKRPNVTAEDVAEITKICHALNGRGSTDKALAALAVAFWRTGNFKKTHQVDTLLKTSLYTRHEPRKIAEDLEKLIPAGAVVSVTK